MMIGRRVMLLWGAATLFAAGALSAIAADQPLAIVTKEDGGNFLTLKHADRRKYISRSLVDLWLRAEKNAREGYVLIDADPVSNSQDPDIASFTVKEEQRDAKRATVAATFTERSAGRRKSALDLTVRYDFLRDGGRWKIDDIRGTVDGKPWSIRKNLEQARKY
jgi:hypothetical protein